MISIMSTTGIPNSYYRTLQWHKLLLCARMHSRVMCLVASVCVYCMCKKLAVWGVTARKSLGGAIYCLLIEFNCHKGAYYARWFVQGRKFGGILLTGWEKIPGKLYYGIATPRVLAIQLAMQCYCNLSADIHYCYRYSLCWQCFTRTGYVFCGTLVVYYTRYFWTSHK